MGINTKMLTVDEIRKLEEGSETRGVSKLQLMQNAGREIVSFLAGRFDLKGRKILVVCYHGNNGGDGLAAATLLAEIAEVTILFLGDESRLRKEAAVQYKKVEKNDLIQMLPDYEEIDFDEYDIIIDAILGVGIAGDLSSPIASVIPLINSSRAFKLSVDVPSGLNPDTGEKASIVVEPDAIITFHDVKPGLAQYGEKVTVADIGIPR
ncbi:MAG TPA: NAD(P)H-hydrate epimerase [Deltaproteobacteria bacterium]|nr:NAD(P)H-hydrate epimerase [Deltaproteobacteria bacterium]HII69030.1 NAD(P)H-hydrate epimerase [Candidatus Woesearchaeota archaeon]